MPSSPKIPKDMILKAALDLLIREGYTELKIKTLAKELDSSTQPISWHFGNMEGLRKALTEFALTYANEKMRPLAENSLEAFTEVGSNYVNIAFDEPNLFRYLYLGEQGGYQAGGVEALISDQDNAELIDGITSYLNVPREEIAKYVQNSIVYTHGLASFIATGVIQSSKEQVMEMVTTAGNAFLLQAGVDLSKISSYKAVRIGGEKQ